MQKTDKTIVKLTNNTSWVGIRDYEIKNFDLVMETKHGTTYNSYFINAQNKTLIDSAKEKFWTVYKEKIEKVTNIKDIKFLITTHTEPDHSGSIKHLLEINPDIIIYGSGQAIRFLSEMIDIPFKSVTIKDGDILDLGDMKLRFLSTPNLHWPDTIYVYLEEEGLLFSSDSFAAHYCEEKMIDNEVENFDDEFIYYFNVILRPYSKFMLKAIEKISDLKINAICPSHGPILKNTWKDKINLTKKLAEEYISSIEKTEINVLIAYVSAYGFTGQIAKFIAQGLNESGIKNIHIVDIENLSLEEMEDLIIKHNAYLIGSPTLNQNAALHIYKFLGLFSPLRDKGKKASSFGSFGWSGEAVKIIENQLKSLKLDVLEGLSIKFSPFDNKIKESIKFGKKFAEFLKSTSN